MLNRIFAVIRREYLAHIRTKAFWISTLIVPIVMGALMIIPAWLATRGAGEFTVIQTGVFSTFTCCLKTLLVRLSWSVILAG